MEKQKREPRKVHRKKHIASFVFFLMLTTAIIHTYTQNDVPFVSMYRNITDRCLFVYYPHYFVMIG